MSFKKALTKMGIIEDNISVPTSKPAPVVSTPNVTSSYAITGAKGSNIAPTNIDNDTAEELQKSLQDNKLSGFDYLKFISATDEMKSSGTSEDMRYKMAFLAAKQLGVDKDSLTKSARHYLDVLKGDETNFNTDCDKFEKEEIQDKENKIKELQSKADSFSQQLAQANYDRDQLSTEVNEKKRILQQKRSSFQTTLQSFVTEIETNILKITRYLS